MNLKASRIAENRRFCLFNDNFRKNSTKSLKAGSIKIKISGILERK